MKQEILKGSSEILVLSVLSDGPLHGYSISRKIRESTGGQFDFSEGTLYPVLHRLQREGLLDAYWQESDGRRRKCYTVTAKGKRAFKDQREALRVFMKTLEGAL